jgi:hypothetical protein
MAGNLPICLEMLVSVFYSEDEESMPFGAAVNCCQTARLHKQKGSIHHL